MPDLYSAIALEALKVIGQTMAFFPNYEQRKAEQYKKLLEEYEQEKHKPYHFRNNEYLLDLGDKLRRHVQSFSKSLPVSVVQRMHEGDGDQKPAG